MLKIWTNASCTQTRTHGTVDHRHSEQHDHDLGACWANSSHEPEYNTSSLRSVRLRGSFIWFADSLLPKWMESMSLKFSWKGQQFARVPGASRPVNEIPVLRKFCNLSKPLRPVLVRDSHNVGKITRSQAAADRQLNAFQQAPRTPFFLEPLDRNGRSTVFCVSTAASLAHREMSDNQPLCC